MDLLVVRSALAAAVLHGGHGTPGLRDSLLHWLLEPLHALPIAALVGAGLLVAVRRRRRRRRPARSSAGSGGRGGATGREPV